MKLGPPLSPEMYPSWAEVQEDIHDVSSRVREYDKDARLCWDKETTQFGLFRWCQMDGIGEAWLLARRLAIHGHTPDARVLDEQRASDIYTKSDPERYRRAMRAGIAMKKESERRARLDSFGESAEQFVHGFQRANGVKRHIYIPSGEERSDGTRTTA